MLGNFLLFSNGISPSIMNDIPDSRGEKFRNMLFGLVNILISLISAALLGFYIYKETEIKMSAVLVGTGWLVFYYVLTVSVQVGLQKEKGRPGKNFLKAIPRILLAVVLSLFITDPAILGLLQADINDEQKLIVKNIETETYNNRKKHHSEMMKPDFDRLIGEKDRINNDLKTRENSLAKRSGEMENQSPVAITETSETALKMQRLSITGQNQRTKNLKEAESDYNSAKQSADKKIPQIEEDISKLNQKVEELSTQDAENARKKAEIANKGYIAQHNVLFHLMQREPYALFKIITIFLVAFLIELTPLFAKTLSSYSAYEARLDELKAAEQDKYAAAQRQREINSQLNEKLAEIDIQAQAYLAERQSKFYEECFELVKKAILGKPVQVPKDLESLYEEMKEKLSTKFAVNSAPSETIISVVYADVQQKVAFKFLGEPENIKFGDLIQGINDLIGTVKNSALKLDLDTLVRDFLFTDSGGQQINTQLPIINQLRGDYVVVMNSK